MSDLSFQEKSALGTLTANLVVGALYFSSAWNLWRADQFSTPIMLKLAFGYVLVLIIGLVIYHAVVAAIDRPESDDERDRLIGWRSAAIGGIVLGFGVFAVIVHVVGGALFGSQATTSPMFIANALLLAVLVATVAELGAKLWFYRRGL